MAVQASRLPTSRVSSTLGRSKMKQTLIIFTFALCCNNAAEAQNFLDRLQTNVEGQGTVTIHQDSSINQLVLDPQATLKPENRPQATHPQGTTPGNTQTTPPRQHVTNSHDSTTTTTPTITQPRQRRGGAYRIQVFAGGNNREDRKRAERAAASVRSRYPNMSVSAHFYPPRWICYAGNFRTLEDAQPTLQAIKGMGYSQALIVRTR